MKAAQRVATNPLIGKVLLFTPGDKPERFAKARAAGADGVIVDLEDAVAGPNKDRARASALEYLEEHRSEAGFLRCLRINALDTADGLKDVLALIRSDAAPDVLLLPKADSPELVALLAKHLEGLPDLLLIALIESARGLEAAFETASATPRLAGLALGGADLTAETGSRLEWDALLYARTRVVHAAASRELAALDVPHLDINDAETLVNESRKVAALGMTNKLAIHPGQIAGIRAAFTPDDAAVSMAQGLIDAWEAAGGGVFQYRGRMVDQPVLRSARRILALASSGR
jgi:(S)-citramalyl-CoA lyase